MRSIFKSFGRGFGGSPFLQKRVPPSSRPQAPKRRWGSLEIIAILIIAGVVIILEQQIFLRLVLKNVTYTVRFSKSEAMEGDTVEIVEEIINDKRLPVPWVKTELNTSRWLEFSGTQAARGSDTRFVPSVFSLRPKQKCTRTRTVTALKRGNFTLESANIVGSDLLGLVSISRRLDINETIRILPSPYELRDGDLSQEELYGEMTARRFICDDPFLISGAREYTGREPMNRIHWNSTARTAKMMVFNNDYTTLNRAAVIMNMQKTPIGDPRPLIVGDTETYIKAAAFIFDTLAANAVDTDFYTNGSGGVHAEGGSTKEDYMRLLRELSEIENTCNIGFDEFVTQMEEYGNYLKDRTDIFIITAYIDAEMIDLASVMRRRGKNVIFYCNDDSVNDPRILRVGRVNKFYFMND